VTLHSHPSHSLMYVVAGRGQCMIETQTYTVGPDTAIIVPAHCRHQLSDAHREPMAVFVVYFTEAIAVLNGALATRLLRARKPLEVPRHYSQQIRRTLRGMLHEQDSRPPQYEAAVQQCLSHIMLELYRAKVQQDKRPRITSTDSLERVREVLDYVSMRHYEQQSLAAAAKMAHLSQRQFANLCRKVTGKGFVSFVNGIRCERARQLLIQGEMPVSAVAFEVGFEELSTFYRAFRRHCGISPMSLRA